MNKQQQPKKRLEATLWGAADALRGNQEPSEYKHVVLGLVFLKYRVIREKCVDPRLKPPAWAVVVHSGLELDSDPTAAAADDPL